MEPECHESTNQTELIYHLKTPRSCRQTFWGGEGGSDPPPLQWGWWVQWGRRLSAHCWPPLPSAVMPFEGYVQNSVVQITGCLCWEGERNPFVSAVCSSFLSRWGAPITPQQPKLLSCWKTESPALLPCRVGMDTQPRRHHDTKQGCTPRCHPHGHPESPRSAAGSRAPSAPAARPIDGHGGHSRERLQLLGCRGGLGALPPPGTPPAPGAVVMAVVAQAAGSHHGFHGSLQAERGGISGAHTHTHTHTHTRVCFKLPHSAFCCSGQGLLSARTSSVQEEESGGDSLAFLTLPSVSSWR